MSAGKLKIAIIGGTGLLGSNLIQLYTPGYDVRAFSRSHNVNIEQSKNTTIDFKLLESELEKYFNKWRPDIIINTVAIVNLKACEIDKNLANIVNVDYATKLAHIAKNNDSYYIHISTDHFYDDDKIRHSEENPRIYLNTYAKTKYLAECEVLRSNSESLVVRTNIIGFRNSQNPSFFEWLLESLENGLEINLFTDYCTSPISVRELGEIILRIRDLKLCGVYNVGSSDVIDKHTFGIRTATRFGFSHAGIRKASISSIAGSGIERARTLGLDVSKIESVLGIRMPTIENTLDTLYDEYRSRF